MSFPRRRESTSVLGNDHSQYMRTGFGIIPFTKNHPKLVSRWAEINAPQTPLEEKLSFPRRRESTAYLRGTKSAINYVHLLSRVGKTLPTLRNY